VKQKPGRDIMIYGRSKILQQNTKARLIDEYQFKVSRVVLSGGKPVFRDRIFILKT
jgi:dihydrofolate reductase